jgi:hypothetical protein
MQPWPQVQEGILFRSALASAGCNLVVFTETLGHADQLIVHDPQRTLPRRSGLLAVRLTRPGKERISESPRYT